MATYKYYLQDKINKSLFGVDENDKVHIIDFFGQKLEFYDLSVVSNKVTALETLLETDKTDVASVIDTYQEIVEFLTGVDSVDTVLDVIDKQIYEEVTYAELVTLRDNGELVPGKQYRIVDYVTTTSQENTSSDYHRFDIIVTADSNNILNENARVCINSREESYFYGNRLQAWEIKYSLDNNPKYSWALDSNIEEAMVVRDDTDNSYYVYFRWPDYDEDDITAWAWYRDASYTRFEEKLKNCIFPYPFETDTNADICTIDLEDMIYTNPNQPPKVGDIVNIGNSPVTITDIGVASAGGKGVIYYMKDDNGNECYYDFKNIKYNNNFIFGNGKHGDASTKHIQSSALSRVIAFNNVIKECKDEIGDWIINECRFSGSDTHEITGNYVGCDCYDINVYGPINLNFKSGNKNILMDEYTFKNITFNSNVSHIYIAPLGLSGNGYIQNIIIYSGVSGTEDDILEIDIDVEDQDYTIEYKHPDAEVRTIALEPAVQALKLYADTFNLDERENWLSDTDYDTWEEFTQSLVEDPFSFNRGIKVYNLTSETVEIEGNTYYIWEVDNDSADKAYPYVITPSADYNYLVNNSFEGDPDAQPDIVITLTEDMEVYKGNIADSDHGTTIIKVEKIQE